MFCVFFLGGGLRLLTFKTISSKGFVRIMAKIKCIQIKITNSHRASQSGFVVSNPNVGITLYIVMLWVCMEGFCFSSLMTLELPIPLFQ